MVPQAKFKDWNFFWDLEAEAVPQVPIQDVRCPWQSLQLCVFFNLNWLVIHQNVPETP